MASYNLIDEHAGDDDVTMRAAAAMATNYIVVVVDTTALGKVAKPAAVTDVPYGILQTTQATVGNEVTVRPISSGRRSLVCCSPATSIALGAALAINVTDATNGKVDTAASTYYPIGVALEAATAANDLIACQLAGSLIPRA